MAEIVIIDDDPIILGLLRTIIHEAGHTPIAVTRVEDVPPQARADLLLIDLVPLKAYNRNKALEWVATLRARFSAVPILIVTAHDAALAEPDRLSADDIISKPFDVESVLTKVRELLASVGGGAPQPSTS